MVVAKNDAIHGRLAALFAVHGIGRRYLAIVHGRPAWREISFEAPLARKRSRRRGYRTSADGRVARSHFRLLEPFCDFSLVEATPETGRTHQIRVHLSSLGHPLCADTLYGGGAVAARRAAPLGLRRAALHAARLTCAELGFDVEAKIPDDMALALDRLRAANNLEERR
jgi:23S rRNA pseudouridine1911/1915/1917 synthase